VKTEQDYSNPQTLVENKDWLSWLTDPAKRLVAATAYRAHPNQDKSKTARGERYKAAILALGETAEVAELVGEQRVPSLEWARQCAADRTARRLADAERCAVWEKENAEREAREAKYWKSAAGRRRARQLKQCVVQLWYICGHDGCTMYLTRTVMHSLLKTPVGGRLTFFDAGTLGDPQAGEARIYQTAKAARRALALKLLREQDHKPSPIAVGREPGLATVDQAKADEWLTSKILPWARRNAGKKARGNRKLERE